MPNRKAEIDFEAYGKIYAVCSRTARRWHQRGLRLDQPQLVAVHLASQKRANKPALENISQILTK